MTFLAITDFGLEPVVADEVTNAFDTDVVVEDTTVKFEADSVNEFIHHAQSIRRVIDLYSYGVMDDVLDASYTVDGSFRVTCERVGEHDFTSQDVERELGAVIVDQTGAGVDLEEPDTVVYCYVIDNRVYVGKDMTGRDLSKRDWKVYSHPTSTRGTIAYALVHWSSWTSGTLLDPFCGCGMIPVEAAIHALGRDPNSLEDPDDSTDVDIYAFDDSAQNLQYGEKNALAARVDEHVRFSKKGVGWLDVTFDENAVDTIVTQPPSPSKAQGIEEVRDVYDELLYQASYVVAGGDVTVLLRDPDVFMPLPDKHGLTVTDTHTLHTGDITYTVVEVSEG